MLQLALLPSITGAGFSQALIADSGSRKVTYNKKIYKEKKKKKQYSLLVIIGKSKKKTKKMEKVGHEFLTLPINFSF